MRLTPREWVELILVRFKRELLAAFDAVTFPLEQLRIAPVPRHVVQKL